MMCRMILMVASRIPVTWKKSDSLNDKNSSDVEKSESLNVGKAESSEESEDELSALSSDGGLKDEQCVIGAPTSKSLLEVVQCVSGARTSKSLLEVVQNTPNKEDKTSSTPPAIDFSKLSLGSAMPKVRIVPSLPSPFFGRVGGKVAGWRRNSFSAVSKMKRVKGKESNPGKSNGYFSADEGYVTKQLTF